MITEVRFAITTDQKSDLTGLIRRLPGILSGRLPDEHNIAAGFKARIGYALLSLILPNFQNLSRGQPGVDGTKWPPLSREYLAYGRRFGVGEQAALKKKAGLGASNAYGPGDKKGLLTPDQLKLWRQTYADRLAWYMMQESDASAKAHAAAIAWIVVKQAGAKTKLEVFGEREAQILVDTGYLRGSLQPGMLTELGPSASYQPPAVVGGSEQIFELEQTQVVVGSSVNYAIYHHAAKNPAKRRRLWPETFPPEWWRQVLGATISGLSKINELFRERM